MIVELDNTIIVLAGFINTITFRTVDNPSRTLIHGRCSGCGSELRSDFSQQISCFIPAANNLLIARLTNLSNFKLITEIVKNADKQYSRKQNFQ
jgi:hypothetical protein